MLFQSRSSRQREEKVRMHSNGQVYFATRVQLNIGEVQDETLPHTR